MFISVYDAVEKAKKFAKERDSTKEIPDKVEVFLDNDAYRIVIPGYDVSIYVCAITGNILWPNHDLWIDFHL